MKVPTVPVIQDDTATRERVVDLLQAAGMRVLAAGNGNQGLAMGLAENPDLILGDMQIPGLSGSEGAQGLRATAGWRRVPVVAVTANSITSDRQKAIDGGFDDHLPKPIDHELFAARVQAYFVAAGDPAAETPPNRRPLPLSLPLPLPQHGQDPGC
ncbi:response regulator [Acidovorax sp. BL-A-41-H1]|uniref:response regulator n=1 Tax=Acidovorax sp. BL-A-41-H1 TaxID=3421102 RepID=UPI003F7A73B3